MFFYNFALNGKNKPSNIIVFTSYSKGDTECLGTIDCYLTSDLRFAKFTNTRSRRTL